MSQGSLNAPDLMLAKSWRYMAIPSYSLLLISLLALLRRFSKGVRWGVPEELLVVVLLLLVVVLESWL
jgi:hypothetical protein